MNRAFGRRAEVVADAAAEPPVPAPAAPPLRPAAAATAAERIRRLRLQVMERVDPVVAAELAAPVLRAQLESLVHEIANRERIEISAREQATIAEELADDMVGYGPLEPLLQDDSISDIMVNGPDRVFVEVRGRVKLTSVRFRSAAQLATIAQKMAASVGRRVDESSPLVDCRLPDGSRVNVVFPPLAIDGACISIRKFAKRKVDLQALAAGGSMSPSVARVLEIAARCRLNVVISGGTGSGKTTMMNAMSQMIDHGERIVTIEDAAELQLQQPHVVRLETRPVNLEGRGEITQRDLIRNALRMRPDRIIVGEVRGAEAFDMLQAMNTGHDGSYCTVHANTTRDALTRIENMVQMGQSSLPSRAIRTQIAGAVDLIVQVARMRDGGRRVLQVSEVVGLEGEVVTMNEVFQFEYEGEDQTGRLRGRWTTPGIRPGFYDRLEYFGLGEAWMNALREA
ncbi:pilus assembly protein CpaF [Siccirubricoccus deserti]|uniref:CpaF family protein n=1 Tax=Siccirubricoccus deserti TaxID=2013562 RepID=A0A9X0UI14_9PROT|nr:CpaF family protein [Siccirubricoccus deserti]MBC4016660.1 CpaF family protein [Siccirubricoccus deserti]GGC50888.1 pilus assembly protein CpaF [Siccirubricoccus deserti]